MSRSKLALLIALTCITHAEALEIYSTFDIPPNVAGSAPLTRGIGQPTRVVFGNPVVEPQFGSLNQSALVFDGRTRYEQIEFRLDGSYEQYRVSFDYESANLNGSSYAFGIFLDSVDVFQSSTSDSKAIWFHGLGVIDAYNPRNSTAEPPRTFNDGTSYHVLIDVDIPANRWTVSYNDLPWFTAPYDSVSQRIHAIRFSLAPWQFGAPDAPEVQAAIDNVHIAAVPEPQSIWLFSAGCCFLLWHLARRRFNHRVRILHERTDDKTFTTDRPGASVTEERNEKAPTSVATKRQSSSSGREAEFHNGNRAQGNRVHI